VLKKRGSLRARNEARVEREMMVVEKEVEKEVARTRRRLGATLFALARLRGSLSIVPSLSHT
jgi:hypothetical protein